MVRLKLSEFHGFTKTDVLKMQDILNTTYNDLNKLVKDLLEKDICVYITKYEENSDIDLVYLNHPYDA